MTSSLRAAKNLRSSQRALFEDIKENCPPLKNVNLSKLKGTTLQEQVSCIASQVPSTVKKDYLNKLCRQQEHKIMTNLQKNYGYSLYKEIEKVNPGLKKELEETHHNELTQKLEHYQKISTLHTNSSSRIQTMEIESSESHQNFEEIFKDDLMDVDLAYLFEKQPQTQILGSNSYNIGQDQNNQYSKKSADFNQVHNLMEEMDMMTQLSHQKRQKTIQMASESQDFSDFFVKKFFDFN